MSKDELLRRFPDMVKRMREAQAVYFKTRSLVALDEAKRSEREVDQALKELAAPEKPPGLFDEA